MTPPNPASSARSCRRLPGPGSLALLALAALTGCAGEDIVFLDGGVDAADLTPPETTLTATPPALGNVAEARFEFTSDRAATFQCKVDDGAALPCTSPFTTSVGEGSHRFEVVGVSIAGVPDATPATFTWDVDLTPPDTTISQGPPALDDSVDVTFEFAATEVATFACTLDGGAATPCTSPFAVTGLAEGPHTLTITATDPAGNVDPTPAQQSWTVDTEAPTVTITGGPSGPTSDSTPTFTFTTAGDPTAVTCRIGTGAFAPCTSSFTPAALADGPATFEVQVVDAVGNRGAATRNFIVDTVPPAVNVTSGPDLSPGGLETFTFTHEAGASTSCRSYRRNQPGGSFTACTSPVSWPMLAPDPGQVSAQWTFEVRAVDAAGNARSAFWDYSTFTIL